MPVLARVRCLALLWLWIAPSLALLANHVDVAATAGGACQAGGTEGPGDLIGGLLTFAIEFAVVVAIVRPWSYVRSWVRSLCVCVPAFLASGFFITSCMPDDAFTQVHALWMLALTLAFFGATVWSAAAALRHHHRATHRS